MMTLRLILAMLLPLQLIGQAGWEWEVLPSMPEPVSNNSVTEAFSGDSLCVYSFTGISEGLQPADIHLKSWRYNTVLGEWTQLPNVDDFQGKIAASASTVGNTIYLIGGYYVDDNFEEQTSDKVHRFDPAANDWLEDGASIPVPVDDHVQAVWRDSLIFVITGWSQTTNVNDVQIYDPASNTWTAGTPTPNTNSYKAFGPSGTIIGDTIYYYGGTKILGFNFIATNELRKGVINPDDPAEIEWSLVEAENVPDGYRMACASFGNEVTWIGGAETAYNFDGLAYSGGAVVEPHQEIRTYNSVSGDWMVYQNSPYAVMDLRGIAQVADDQWIIAGGMTSNAEVSKEVYLIRRATVATAYHKIKGLKLFNYDGNITLEGLPEGNFHLQVYDLTGRLVLEKYIGGYSPKISISVLNTGIYIVSICSIGEKSNSQSTFKIHHF